MKANEVKLILKQLRPIVNDNLTKSRDINIGIFENQTLFNCDGNTSTATFSMPFNNDGPFGFKTISFDLFNKAINCCRNNPIDFKIENNLLKIKSNNKSLLEYSLSCQDDRRDRKKIIFTNHRELNTKKVLSCIAPISYWCDPNSKYEDRRGIYFKDNLSYTADPQKIVVYKANPFERDFFLYSSIIDFLSNFEMIVLMSIKDDFINIKSDFVDATFNTRNPKNFPEIEKYINMDSFCSFSTKLETLEDISNSISVTNSSDFLLESNDDGRIKASGKGFDTSYEIVLDSKINSSIKSLVPSDFFVKLVKAFSILNDDRSMEVKIEFFGDHKSIIRFSSGNLIQMISVKSV